MEQLDKTSARPLYVQLDDVLRAKIEQGVWKENQMIPSENELAKMYNISRVTARSVVKNLVSEGLLYRVQGKGTFVASPKIMTRSSAWGGIESQLENLGMKTEVSLIHFEEAEPTESVAKKLKISSNTPVWHIICLCQADDVPVSIHKTFIPCHLCPTLKAEELSNGKLYEKLRDRFNLTPDIIYETLETTHVTENEAKLLNIKRNEMSIFVEIINKTHKGSIYRFDKIIIRGDKIKLHFEYGDVNSPWRP